MLTSEEYIKGDSSICPNCRSSDIEGESFDMSDKEVSQKVSCNECDTVWYDVYTLNRLEVVTED